MNEFVKYLDWVLKNEYVNNTLEVEYIATFSEYLQKRNLFDLKKFTLNKKMYNIQNKKFVNIKLNKSLLL